MIAWLTENALTLGIALLGAGGWLGFIIKNHKENKKERAQTIKELKSENLTLREEIRTYRSIEKTEKSIDKSQGTIYFETLPGNKKRAICGYCWEKDHIKIPVIPRLDYDESARREIYIAFCQNCKICCSFYDEYENSDSRTAGNGLFDSIDDLPF